MFNAQFSMLNAEIQPGALSSIEYCALKLINEYLFETP